jgi:acetyltransferase-like isoleucine patch superfamily enzyme
MTLFKSFVKSILRKPPRGMKCGSGVTVQRPHNIAAADHISLGDRSFIGKNALIAPILEYAGVRYDPRIRIGNDVYIGPNVYIASHGQIIIGDGSVLSEYVFLNDSGHGLDPEAGLIMKQKLVHAENITIGRSCFLGLRSAIMSGVTLGDHCVVGVNSVVTKSFPAYSMVAGSPARLVRRYSFKQKAWISPLSEEFSPIPQGSE